MSNVNNFPQRPQGQPNMANRPNKVNQPGMVKAVNQPMPDGVVSPANKKSGLPKWAIIVLIAINLLVLGGLGYFVLSGNISSQVRDANVKIEQLTDSYESQIAQLRSDLETMSIAEYRPASSLVEVDGTAASALKLLEEDTFVVPNPIVVSGASEAPASSYMQVGPKFCFRPSSRWLASFSGPVLNLKHPSGISFSAKALSYSGDNLDYEAFSNFTSKFYEGYPAATGPITSRKVFLEDRVVGCLKQGTFSLSDSDGVEKPTVVMCGLIQKGDSALTVVALWDASSEEVAQGNLELVQGLFTGCSAGPSGAYITLE